MMLAPPRNKLQPLPQNVQPAVSQNVQRSASAADLQTIQNSQAAAQQSTGQQSDVSSGFPLTQSSASSSFPLWTALIAAVVVAAGVVWIWRSL